MRRGQRVRELTVEVPDKSGSLAVSAIVDRPRGARALFVLGHGAGAGMRHPFLETLSGELVARRIATLRYQFPYMEAGRRRPDHATRLVRTVRAAVARSRRAVRGLPVFVGGKSMGGRIASLAESEETLEVAGLIFVGFPLHRPGGADLARAEPLEKIAVPMLFLQGTRDALADLEAMRRVCRELGRRATLHVVEGGDHSFHVLKRSGRTDAEVMTEIANRIEAWIGDRVGRADGEGTAG